MDRCFLITVRHHGLRNASHVNCLKISAIILGRLVLLIGIALSTVSSLAQGVLNFSNKTNGLDAPVFDLGCQLSAYKPDVAELYYGPPGAPACLLIPMWPYPVINTGQYFNNGYFNAGAITIDGFLPGQTITAQVRVWDSTRGLYWEDAVRMMSGTDGRNRIGVSPLFEVTLTGPPDPPGNLTGLQSFCLYYPETINENPKLSVQLVLTNILFFSWTANSGEWNLGRDNFLIQQNSSLYSTNWVTLTNVPWTDWMTMQVATPKPATTTFYRLISHL